MLKSNLAGSLFDVLQRLMHSGTQGCMCRLAMASTRFIPSHISLIWSCVQVGGVAEQSSTGTLGCIELLVRLMQSCTQVTTRYFRRPLSTSSQDILIVLIISCDILRGAVLHSGGSPMT